MDYTYYSIQGPNGAHRTHRMLDHTIAYDCGGGAGGAAAVFGVVYVLKDMCNAGFSLSLSLSPPLPLSPCRKPATSATQTVADLQMGTSFFPFSRAFQKLNAWGQANFCGL